jgi:hypothetical protein
VVPLDFLNGCAIQHDPIADDPSNAGPMHRRKPWRIIPRLQERFLPDR